MSIHVVLKNPGEKLVHIDVEFIGNIIALVHISGDFFIYPEEAINDIEQSLQGTSANKELLEQRIGEVLKNKNTEMVGISATTIAQGIMEAFLHYEK
ncbi:MAG: lipoate protein ligase C-terminal domain-containing protein [Spirochaetota bacterium]